MGNIFSSNKGIFLYRDRGVTRNLLQGGAKSSTAGGGVDKLEIKYEKCQNIGVDFI